MTPDNNHVHTTFPRWTALYCTVLAVLAGWLLLEKRADGREVLLNSMENTFLQSRSAIARDHTEFVQAMREEAADYPSGSGMEYTNRAAKVLTSLGSFEHHCNQEVLTNQFNLLKDSLMILVDGDAFHLNGGVIDATFASHYLKGHETLKTNQTMIKAQILAGSALYYCATKVYSNGSCEFWHPYFLPATPAPMVGQPYQATVFLSTTESRLRCAKWTGFLNNRVLYLRDGIAPIHTIFPTAGAHTLHLRFRRGLCRDGSITEFSRDFQVNVLERCDSIPPR